MTQSPGHKQHPNHQVRENRLTERVKVQIGVETVADSKDVVEVDEDGHQKRYYFSRSDVAMSNFKPSETKSTCPFKGEATYYHLESQGKIFTDAAWSYENPYDEHQALKDRVAFDEAPTWA